MTSKKSSWPSPENMKPKYFRSVSCAMPAAKPVNNVPKSNTYTEVISAWIRVARQVRYGCLPRDGGTPQPPFYHAWALSGARVAGARPDNATYRLERHHPARPSPYHETCQSKKLKSPRKPANMSSRPLAPRAERVPKMGLEARALCALDAAWKARSEVSIARGRSPTPPRAPARLSSSAAAKCFHTDLL